METTHDTTEAPAWPPLATYPALMREIHHAREAGHYEIAAELEERFQAPITVRGREYAPQHTSGLTWWCHDDDNDWGMRASLFLSSDGWNVLMGVTVDGVHIQMRASGHTAEAALDACAPARYPAPALRAMGRALDALGVVDPLVERVRKSQTVRMPRVAR